MIRTFLLRLTAAASLTMAMVATVRGADDKPTPMPLYDGKVPHAVGDDPADKPTLTVFLPPKDKATGTAIVVIPGGGYGGLAMGHEGKDIVEWLNERGVAAFLLKYRVATKGRPGPLHPAPMLDAQRAIRTVRAKAKDYGVNPHHVGIWGFSAGGHLASTAATHFDKGNPDATDPIEKVGSRPDFVILAYPVITMEPKVTHGGSRKNLIGEKPDEKLIELLSNEKQVTKDTPPTFLFHTREDKVVLLENSQRFHDACKKQGVPVELVVYDKGPHGVGLAKKDAVLSKWTEKLEEWMKERELLKK